MKKCCKLCGAAGLTVAGAVLSAPVVLALHGEAGLGDSSLWAAGVTCGIGIAYLLKSAGLGLMGLRAKKNDPLAGIDAADRAAALEAAEGMDCGCGAAAGLKPLLAAWGRGATGPQVARMAATQMTRRIWAAVVEAAAVLAVLSAGAGFEAPQSVLTCGTVLMALSALAGLSRVQGVASAAKHVECHLLAKIGADTPAAAAEDFAGKAAKAVGEATAELGKAMDAAAAKLGGAVSAASGEMSAGQKAAADKMSAGQAELAKQLDKVSGVASSVEKLLQLQKSVDGTLAAVTATSEFKETLVELRRHLAEADQILKDAKKPRKMRLVESASDEG